MRSASRWRAAPTRPGGAGGRDRCRSGRDRRPALRPGRCAAPPRRPSGHAVRDLPSMIWAGVLVASIGCYALKLAGLSLPQRWLRDPRIQRTVPLIPIALLAALVSTQTFATGRHLTLDVRAAALVVA